MPLGDGDMTNEQCIAVAEKVKKRRRYNSVHEWLRTQYGKADLCEIKTCAGKSKRFEWSLKKGFTCEKKRENFWMLCSACHIKYDKNPDTINKMRKTLTGRKLSPEHVKKIAEANTGSKRSPESRARMSAKQKGRKLSEAHKKKISEGMKKRKATHLAALEAVREEE